MTKIVNKDQPMTLFGEKTPRAVIYKSESHKLHQAFCVKDGETTQSINSTGLIGVLTKEIQELKKDNKRINEILAEFHKNKIEY